MFTSNTDLKRFEEYCEQYESATCVNVEFLDEGDEESYIEITWQLSGKQWPQRKYIMNDEIAGMSDDEIIDYVEQNLVD